jgi:hypothetical protein
MAMTGVSLKDLARLSRELNEASDALSEQIAQVELALNELKLGVRAYVKVRSVTSQTSGGEVTTEQYLGYAKCRGKWCLTLIDANEQFPEDATEIPLREAPRGDRIDAVEKLPDLIRKLEGETRRIVAEARNKAAKVEQFAATLKKS